jgi:2-iminobutanoate/2-iminopropanoate deaminase
MPIAAVVPAWYRELTHEAALPLPFFPNWVGIEPTRRTRVKPSDSYDREVLVKAPKENLPFSTAIGCGPFVFVSGLVGRDPGSGQIARGDIAAQTEQAMRNMSGQLERAGTSLGHALKATIFVTDMGGYARMNEAYGSFFEGSPPARSCVEVSRLPDPEALVEIEMIALRPAP